MTLYADFVVSAVKVARGTDTVRAMWTIVSEYMGSGVSTDVKVSVATIMETERTAVTPWDARLYRHYRGTVPGARPLYRHVLGR